MDTSPEVDYSLAFDIVYRPFGGRWVRESNGFQSGFLAYVESMPTAMVGAVASRWHKQPEGKRATLPSMHFGLIDGQAFNCFATRFNQNYFVGIGALVPFALLEAASYFFAQPWFYPEIGDPSEGPLIALDGVDALPLFQLAENRFSPRTRQDLSDRESIMLARGVEAVRASVRHHHPESRLPLSANEYIGQFDTLLDMLMPICVVRREHCRYLASVVAHFFWFHEIAHVTQGHLRSLQDDQEKLLTLCEFPQGDGATAASDSVLRLSEVTTLAMELDADVEAILMTIGIIMLDIDIETDDFPYATRYERVGLFVLFLTIVFQILANHEARRTSTKSTHPPASIRLVNMLAHLTHIASEDKEITEAVVVGLRGARRLAMAPHCHFLSGVLDGTESFTEKWGAVYKHRASLTKGYDVYRYGNLRPLIAKFLEGVSFRDKMTLGPEPDWWDRDA